MARHSVDKCVYEVLVQLSLCDILDVCRLSGVTRLRNCCSRIPTPLTGRDNMALVVAIKRSTHYTRTHVLTDIWWRINTLEIFPSGIKCTDSRASCWSIPDCFDYLSIMTIPTFSKLPSGSPLLGGVFTCHPTHIRVIRFLMILSLGQTCLEHKVIRYHNECHLTKYVSV